MDARERLILNLSNALREAKPPVRWHRAKDWHLDEPLRQRLIEAMADRILNDPTIEVRAVERVTSPAPSVPGGKMPD